MKINEQDLTDLKAAKQLLENPGVVAKLTDIMGTPIEKGFKMLPEGWSEKIGDVVKTSLEKATEVAIFTMKEDRQSNGFSGIGHKLAVATTGAVGGAFGLPALAVELPISTTIMLRSILDIARGEGESINEVDCKLACIEVFALGGPLKSDDCSESGYFAIKAALAKSVSDAAKYVTGRGIAEEGAPALIRLIVQIAERFSIQVSEKAAAQAIPLVGAAGGALINTLFMGHFQDMARGHFIIRRLERVYGEDLVKQAYIEL